MHIKIEKGKKKSIKIIVIMVKGELQKQIILSPLTLYSLQVLQYIRKSSNISIIIISKKYYQVPDVNARLYPHKNLGVQKNACL